MNHITMPRKSRAGFSSNSVLLGEAFVGIAFAATTHWLPQSANIKLVIKLRNIFPKNEQIDILFDYQFI